MKIVSAPKLIKLFAFILIMFLSLCFSRAQPTSPRPDPNNAPLFARWMINQGSWGVLTTIDPQNAPFGNVMSYSDGATGIPYFYLTTSLDPTGEQALINPKSSLTLSEREFGSCDASTDAQLPNCAKITLSGKLKLLEQNPKETMFAQSILFAQHPRFAGWPSRNGTFKFFKLEIESIFLVDSFAPAKNPTVSDYLHANVSA